MEPYTISVVVPNTVVTVEVPKAAPKFRGLVVVACRAMNSTGITPSEDSTTILSSGTVTVTGIVVPQ